MQVRTWLVSFCAALGMFAAAACNHDNPSPVAPDDVVSGAPLDTGPEGNSAPVITTVTASPAAILISETSTLTATVTDADGDRVNCTWSLDGGGTLVPQTNTCTAVLRPTQTGTLEVSVRARDARGATSAVRTVEVTVSRDGRPGAPQPGLDPNPNPKPNPGPNPNPEPDPNPGPDPNPNPNPNPNPGPNPSPTPIPPTVNRPPVVSITADPAGCTAPCTVTVKATASDPDDDPLTLTFGGCASGTVKGSYGESRCELLTFAEVVASVTVSDPEGATAQASVVIEAQPTQNHPPTVTLRTGADSCHPHPDVPCRINLTAAANDVDPGDSVSYTWSGCASGNTATATCLVTAPEKFSAAVTVRDRSGAAASASVLVFGVNRAPDGAATAEAVGCHPYPGACQVDVSASGNDPDGDVLSYTWSGCAGVDGKAATCTVPALATQAQTASVTIHDGWTSVTRTVSVAALNRQPSVEASGGSSCHPRPGQPCTVPVAAVASDPDGDPVTIDWFDCASGTGSRGTCRIETLGNTQATATARDPFGARRLATVSSYGTNQAAHAIASPSTSSGASATFTLSWADQDSDIVTCELVSSDSRCVWGSCSVGGLSALK